MKGKFKYQESRGLPGGPNEMFTYVTGVFSTEGYKRNSPDVNNPYNVIPSGNITMKGVDFPVVGTDNLGNTKMMMPGKDYKFPGDMVFELPMAQDGIEVKGRKGVRQNPDGTVSTHLMAREYVPDRGWVAFPTLFQNEDGTWMEIPMDKGWGPAYEEAVKRGEVYDFGEDEKAAIKFADEGSWKQPIKQQGGDLGKGIKKGSLYGYGYYRDDLTGAHVPSAGLAFQTGRMGPQSKSGWSLGARVGIPYSQFDPSSLDPEIPFNQTFANVYGKSPVSAEFNASYLGGFRNHGDQGKAFIDLKSAYTPHSGFGISATAGPQFNFGTPYARNSELRPGKAHATVTPFGGWAVNLRPQEKDVDAFQNKSGFVTGLSAEAEWKPKFLKKTPLSLYGKGAITATHGLGKKDVVMGDVDIFFGENDSIQTVQGDATNSMSARWGVNAEAGVRVPVQKLPRVNMPTIPMPDLSPLKSQFSRAEMNAQGPQIDGDINGGSFERRVNASTWDGKDIYVGDRKNMLPKNIELNVPQEKYQEGGEETSWTDYINPMNWGVTNRDEDGDFKQAFRAARNAGDDEFMWHGTRYNTELASGEQAKPEEQKPSYNPNILKGLSEEQKARRQALLNAANVVANAQDNDENLRRLLVMSAVMENTLGADANAYSRDYTRGPMSIDDIAYQDLFAIREGAGGYTAQQKKNAEWLNQLGLDASNIEQSLRSDDPLAGMAAARLVYGRAPEALPSGEDPDALYNYYLKYYNKGGVDKYGGADAHKKKFTDFYNQIYRQEGGEQNQFQIYKDYVYGVYDGTEMAKAAEKVYDKLNRVYYKEAKQSGTTVPNYILSTVMKQANN